MYSNKKIFIASANAYNGNHSYLEKLRIERTIIVNLIKNCIRPELVTEDNEATFQTIFDKFNDLIDKPQITFFHYMGHSNAEQIYLHNDGEGNLKISNQTFVDFLMHQKKLEIVVLNSCCSETLGELILRDCPNVKAVIETTSLIGDEAAALFAKMFYQGLVSGKNLASAFAQANVLQPVGKDKKRDTSDYNQNKVEAINLWKLSIRDEQYANNWTLIDRPHHRAIEPEIDIRILAIYEDNSITKNKIYYELIRKTFLNDKNICIYSLYDLEQENEKESYVKAADEILIFLSSALSEDRFWSKLEWLKPLIINASIMFIRGDDNTTINSDKIMASLEKQYAPSLPNTGFCLSLIPDGSLNNFYSAVEPDILKWVKKTEQNELLIQRLFHLNFDKQYQPFKDNPYWFGFYNLILIEGSQNCAQELFVKRLKGIANIDPNVQNRIITFDNSVNGFLSEEKLYPLFYYALTKKDYQISVDAMKVLISQEILNIVNQNHLIVILNDIKTNSEESLRILQSFWNEITKLLPEKPEFNVYIFVINKGSAENKKSWSEQGFRTDDSTFKVKSLEVIEKLQHSDFKTWFDSSWNDFSRNTYFSSFLNSKSANQIIQEPTYMSDAIREICILMRCKNAFSEVKKL